MTLEEFITDWRIKEQEPGFAAGCTCTRCDFAYESFSDQVLEELWNRDNAMMTLDEFLLDRRIKDNDPSLPALTVGITDKKGNYSTRPNTEEEIIHNYYFTKQTLRIEVLKKYYANPRTI